MSEDKVLSMSLDEIIRLKRTGESSGAQNSGYRKQFIGTRGSANRVKTGKIRPSVLRVQNRTNGPRLQIPYGIPLDSSRGILRRRGLYASQRGQSTRNWNLVDRNLQRQFNIALGRSRLQVAKRFLNQRQRGSMRGRMEGNEWACTNWFEYMLVVVLASLLLLGALTLVLFWVLYYRNGFAWTENPALQFNLHPVLMTAGFISFSGFSLLLYRVCRCCRRIYVKLLHTIFHALAIPCIVVGFLAVLDSHNLATPPIPNFYSLHSWMGLVTMGLFALQFIVGFFSFLILLCCEGATAAFRASLVPIHASFGITTFMLAVATCLTGLTEKAFFSLKNYNQLPEEAVVINSLSMTLTAAAIVIGYIMLRDDFKFRGTNYSELPQEAIIINALAMVLVALGILLSYAVRRESFRSQFKSIITERL